MRGAFAMTGNKTNDRYPLLLIGLHWLMLLLFVAVYACIELREWFPKGSDPREALKAWHFMLGLLIALLVMPRLVIRYRGSLPAISPAPPAWQNLAAKLMHIALYALMIAMPLLGWLLLSAAGKPIPFFGQELPALIAKDQELAKVLKELHETLGEIGYCLIGLHIAAVLYHHYRQHDNTLARMLPSLGKLNP